MKYWLYYFIKTFMEIPFRAYFKSVSIDGKHKIPKGKPVLICASHAGSFMDGVVIEYAFREKVFTLVRGDAFNKPVFDRILRSMLLLPIFRSRDADPEKARVGNLTTWNESYELFREGYKILIFSEGIAYPEKALRPLKKGSAGMAANMIKRSGGDMDLYVLPCGVNYSQFGGMRTDLQISYGDPIRVLDFEDEILADERKFARDFTVILQEKMNDLVVKTKGDHSVEKDFLHQMLINEYGNRSDFRSYDSGSDQIPKRIDKLSADLIPKIKEYKAGIEQSKIADRNLSDKGFNFFAVLIALCTSAMSVPAAILYRLLWAVAKNRTKKLVKNIVLFDSVHFGLGLIMTFFWLAVLIVAAVFLLPEPWTPIWTVLALIASIVGSAAWFVTVEEFRHSVKELRYFLLPRSKRKYLRALRVDILNAL